MFDVEDNVKQADARELIKKEDKSVQTVVNVFLKNRIQFGKYSAINQKCADAFSKFLKEIAWRSIYPSNEWWKEPPYETNQLGVYTGNGNVQNFTIYVWDLKDKSKMVTIYMELDWNKDEMYFNIESVPVKKFVKEIWGAPGVIKKYVMRPLEK